MLRNFKLKLFGRSRLKGSKIIAFPKETANPEKFYLSSYFSEEIICEDCGTLFTHTAKEKQNYFEVEKGNIYKRFIRCLSCHEIKYAKK